MLIGKILYKIYGEDYVQKKRYLFDNKQILSNFWNERRIHRGQKIRVVFLIQYMPCWNKTRLVYECIAHDERFNAYLVCLPSQIIGHKVSTNPKENDNFFYMKNNGYADVINAIQEDGSLMDLQKLNPDYVFYSRPYHDYLPFQYYSNIVSKYAKVCFIPYAIALSKESQEFALNKDFFSNVAYYFSESKGLAKSAKTIARRQSPIVQWLGWKKIVCCGVPSLTEMFKIGEQECEEDAEVTFKIVWTPRWANGGQLGGSNFLKFYRDFLQYAKVHPDVKFVFRPHPFTFSNFVSTGEMTEVEVEQYRRACASMENVTLDEAKDYALTFWHSSVLVSDFSSIMPEYFITGKPLIYCPSVTGVTLTEDMKKLLEGCYIADTQQDVFRYLEALQQGIDPLKDKRQMIAKNVFSKHLEDSDVCIMNELLKGKGFWWNMKMRLKLKNH